MYSFFISISVTGNISLVLQLLFSPAQQPNAGQGRLILQVSNHTQWHTTVGSLLWMRDQLVAESSIWQHITFTTSMPPAEFEPTIPASDRRQTIASDSSAYRHFIHFNFNCLLMALDLNICPRLQNNLIPEAPFHFISSLTTFFECTKILKYVKLWSSSNTCPPIVRSWSKFI
jgi:hypothetical protein